MAVEKGPKLDWSAPAAVDLSGKQFTFVKATAGAADTHSPVAADTDRALGVLNNAPKAGDGTEVVLSGVVKVIAGGTIAKNDPIGHNAAGLAVTRVLGTDTTKYVYGIALEAGTAGQVISVAVSTATAFLAK